MKNSWKDIVYFDVIGVEGKSLSQVLLEYATEDDLHDEGDLCYCLFCQVFIPMARHLENQIDDFEKQKVYR